MADIYDNWDRLVRATLRREQLRLDALRSPSDLSLASPSSSSFNFNASLASSSSSSFNLNASFPRAFTYRELAYARKKFRPKYSVRGVGFTPRYKGLLESGQVVVIKSYDRNGFLGEGEFRTELLILRHLHHPNIVNLIGYCADKGHRLLVYEFLPLGSLKDRLRVMLTDVPPDKEPLDWNTRMKIAVGAAKGLEYLHKDNPPIIYRDLKPSNILLDEGYHPKLTDFGLAKPGPVGDNAYVTTAVIGTMGYCEPDHLRTGRLSIKSDVYSFGVVLLELITGRKAIDNTGARGEENLVAWARPHFKDRRKYPKMADPLLQGRYPMGGLYQALSVAALCLQEQAAARPAIGDVVTALTYLASQTFDSKTAASQNDNVGPSTSRPM